MRHPESRKHAIMRRIFIVSRRSSSLKLTALSGAIPRLDHWLRTGDVAAAGAVIAAAMSRPGAGGHHWCLAFAAPPTARISMDPWHIGHGPLVACAAARITRFVRQCGQDMEGDGGMGEVTFTWLGGVNEVMHKLHASITGVKKKSGKNQYRHFGGSPVAVRNRRPF